jgi:transposase
LRTKTGKKPGGQKGHPGATLWWVEEPDRVVVHDPEKCEGCGMDLQEVEPSDGYERRQLIDVPPLALSVTEHRARRKKCLGCGRANAAPFPEEANGGVVRGVGYGPRVKALCV